MDVLILHYHLNPGGVTRIIESQVGGMYLTGERHNIKILCGVSGQSPGLKDTRVIQNPVLNYTGENISSDLLMENISAIMSLVKSNMTGDTIIHAHNPNLGKNPALTVALYNIASQGIPVINHCHDFPEDRPANMNLLKRVIPIISSESINNILYPDFPKYRFIVLNSCDYGRLVDLGVTAGKIRLLQNPVAEFTNSFDEKRRLKEKVCSVLKFNPDAILCSYPVRAIKRKNIGEFILMSVLFAGIANFAITMAPANPGEIPAYLRWKEFCRHNSIPVRFEAGEAVNYEELIAASDFCITTSLREGFGMVYLEPWLAGTPVIGRELSCVINDLKQQGIRFPRLYDRFRVILDGKEGDFKDLSQDDQEKVISACVRRADTRENMLMQNRFLETWLNDIPAELILNNQEIIRQKFSLNEYGKQLLGIYSEVSHRS